MMNGNVRAGERVIFSPVPHVRWKFWLWQNCNTAFAARKWWADQL